MRKEPGACCAPNTPGSSCCGCLTLAQPVVASPARADDSWHNFIQIWWDFEKVYPDLPTITDNGNVIVYEGKTGWEGQGLVPVRVSSLTRMPGDAR